VADACPAGIAAPPEGKTCAELSPGSVALSDTHVFWGHYQGGAVLSAPKEPGAPALVFAAVTPFGIGVNGGRVHFAQFWGTRVTSTSLSGDSPVHIDGENGPRNLFVDGAHAVWITNGATATESLIGILPLGGGAPTHFRATGYLNDVVSDATTIYATNYDRKAVVAQPKGGGASTDFATGQGDVWCITTTANEVLWGTRTASGELRIMRAPKSGGAPSVLVAGVAGPLVADATALYYHDGSVLHRKDLSDGSAPLPLARTDISSLLACRSIAVDGQAVFWTDAAKGKIFKVAR
jgi:hypothetical protein